MATQLISQLTTQQASFVDAGTIINHFVPDLDKQQELWEYYIQRWSWGDSDITLVYATDFRDMLKEYYEDQADLVAVSEYMKERLIQAFEDEYRMLVPLGGYVNLEA